MMDRLDAYRIAANKLATYACNGSQGRDEADPVYRAVTEGRDVGAMQDRYSSCGDLAHWLLFRLGVRESWINRSELPLGGWRVGRNISNLCWKPCPSRHPHVGERFGCGDILVIYSRDDGKDAHAMVVLEHEGNIILSADYGQPGGELKTRKLSGMNLGGREIRYVLPLPMALTGTLEAPDYALLETLLTGEELDAIAEATEFALARDNRPERDELENT